MRTLAEAVAAEVKARRAIEKERAGLRKESQAIIVVLGIFIGGLVVFTRHPRVYGSVQDQVVLLILGIIVLLGLWMMRRLSIGGSRRGFCPTCRSRRPREPVVIWVLVAGAVFGLAVGVLMIYWLVPQRVSLRDALALDRTMLSAAVLEQEALPAPANPVTRNRWVGFARALSAKLV